MLQIQTISVREMLRNYRQVALLVKTGKSRVTIVSKNEPQIGIVSLEDLKRLEELDRQTRYQQSTKSLLAVAKRVREVLKDEKLPSDLSARHDYYHYEDDKK